MSELKGAKEIPPAGIARKLSTEFKTGDRRALRPVLDESKCTKCMLCRYYCPEGAIHYDKENDRLRIDYDFCKGCGICANECPVKAIRMVPERRALLSPLFCPNYGNYINERRNREAFKTV